MESGLLYPGIVLQKVIAQDHTAWERITARADAMHEEQKKGKYLPIKKDDTWIPNPVTVISNVFARASNAMLENSRAPYFFHSMISHGHYAGLHGLPVMDYAPRMMSPNISRALIAEIEQGGDKILKAAGITAQEMKDLRSYAGRDRQHLGPAPANG